MLVDNRPAGADRHPAAVRGYLVISLHRQNRIAEPGPWRAPARAKARQGQPCCSQRSAHGLHHRHRRLQVRGGLVWRGLHGSGTRRSTSSRCPPGRRHALLPTSAPAAAQGPDSSIAGGTHSRASPAAQHHHPSSPPAPTPALPSFTIETTNTIHRIWRAAARASVALRGKEAQLQHDTHTHRRRDI